MDIRLRIESAFLMVPEGMTRQHKGCRPAPRENLGTVQKND